LPKAVDLQAIYRAYRYGQDKPVFVYRFLTEGTCEEKVYSRSVNKTSLSLRVIDKKHPERNFKSSELQNLLETDTWVQCDHCEKWRMLPPEADVMNLPEKWFCRLNVFDPDRSYCEADEKDKEFYASLFAGRHLMEGSVMEHSDTLAINVPGISNVKEAETLAYTKRDIILSHLVEIMSGSLDTAVPSVVDWKKALCKEIDTKINLSKEGHVNLNKGLVSKYYFHDSLLKDEENFSDASPTAIVMSQDESVRVSLQSSHPHLETSTYEKDLNYSALESVDKDTDVVAENKLSTTDGLTAFDIQDAHGSPKHKLHTPDMSSSFENRTEILKTGSTEECLHNEKKRKTDNISTSASPETVPKIFHSSPYYVDHPNVIIID
jgi:hypothetical protein